MNILFFILFRYLDFSIILSLSSNYVEILGGIYRTKINVLNTLSMQFNEWFHFETGRHLHFAKSTSC